MKKAKKIVAILLSALMLVSSAPITAFAVDPALSELKSAIISYETKMNGTVYSNMKDAYNKYITAKEYAYAYEYGNKKTLDIVGATNNLVNATNAMTVWTKAQVVSPTFTYGSVVPAEFSSGIVYASAPQVLSGYQTSKWQVAFLMPKDVVFLYEGSDLKIPVMVAGNNQGQWAGTWKAFCDVYPTTGTASSEDNRYFQFNQVWNGSYDINTSSNDTPLSAGEFNWNNAYYNDGQTNKGDVLRGFNYLTAQNTNGDDNKRSQKINCNAVNENHKKLWRQYANYLEYVDTAKDLPWNNGLQTVNISWSVKSWDQFSNAIQAYYDTGTTFYVIDYRGVSEALTAAASSFLNFVSKAYTQHQLNTILDAIEALQANPTSGFTNSNFATKAATTAKNIKDNIAILNAATASENDMSSYDTLASAITMSTAVYNNNNAGGVYTTDSFAAFKTAYQASVAEAAKVETNGFTTATTGDALIAAYNALNKVTKPTGGSGDTTYTFDEGAGVLTITGPGAMDDYLSGEDSPVGSNDAITEIVIADDVTYIGENAFKNCRNLRRITVPATLTYGAGAFDDCPELEEVIIINGEIKKASAANSPWKQPSVLTVRLGVDGEDEKAVTGFADGVFISSSNTAFYVYNPDCTIPTNSNATFGNNPTIHAYTPSTGYYYAEQYNYLEHNFISLGHEHYWVLNSSIAATCTVGGYNIYKCKYCTQTKNDDFVSAKGHVFDEGTAVPATCTEKGYTLYTCTVCGAERKKDYVTQLGHSYTGTTSPTYPTGVINDGTSNVVYKHTTECIRNCGSSQDGYCSFKIDGTTVQDGQTYIIFKCDVCNGTYLVKSDLKENEYNVFYFGVNNEIKHTEIVKAGEYPKEVPALTDETPGHTYKWQLNGADVNPSNTVINNTVAFQEVEVIATFTVNYYEANGTLISNETVQYGSKPANVPAIETAAVNRADAGHEVIAWENDADPANTVITSNKNFKKAVVLKEHNFTDTIIEQPTCTEVGYMSRYCDECGYGINRVDIEAIGHDIVIDEAVPATCSATGLTQGEHCSRCSYKVKQETVPKNNNHTWDGGKITVQPTITSEGKKVYTCTSCKTTKTEAVPKLKVADITPSDKEADAAPVNKSINRPKKVRTTSFSKKKQMRVRFGAIAGAQNYRVMYRKAGEKTWKYAWTDGKTEYYFKKLAIGGLYEFRFAAYKKNANGKWERGNYSNLTRRYYYKHALKSAKAGKGKITLKWKVKKGATAYQVQYSLKKNMKGAKTITIANPKATSYVIKSLKKGKNYYVRVRANKKYNKKNFTGEYSKRLKVKVK